MLKRKLISTFFLISSILYSLSIFASQGQGFFYTIKNNTNAPITIKVTNESRAPIMPGIDGFNNVIIEANSSFGPLYTLDASTSCTPQGCYIDDIRGFLLSIRQGISLNQQGKDKGIFLYTSSGFDYCLYNGYKYCYTNSDNITTKTSKNGKIYNVIIIVKYLV